jgi:hypothetical protein
MASPPSNRFFMVGLLERLFLAPIMSRLNPQGHYRVLISIVEQRCQATKKRKPCGGSKFKGSTFKVRLQEVSEVPIVPVVQPLRYVQAVEEGDGQDFTFFGTRDRRRYLHWVFEAKKRLGLSVFNYMVTSNHIHLLVKDTGPNVIAQSMQLIAGPTAQSVQPT